MDYPDNQQIQIKTEEGGSASPSALKTEPCDLEYTLHFQPITEACLDNKGNTHAGPSYGSGSHGNKVVPPPSDTGNHGNTGIRPPPHTGNHGNASTQPSSYTCNHGNTSIRPPTDTDDHVNARVHPLPDTGNHGNLNNRAIVPPQGSGYNGYRDIVPIPRSYTHHQDNPFTSTIIVTNVKQEPGTIVVTPDEHVDGGSNAAFPAAPVSQLHVSPWRNSPSELRRFRTEQEPSIMPALPLIIFSPLSTQLYVINNIMDYVSYEERRWMHYLSLRDTTGHVKKDASEDPRDLEDMEVSSSEDELEKPVDNSLNISVTAQPYAQMAKQASPEYMPHKCIESFSQYNSLTASCSSSSSKTGHGNVDLIPVKQESSPESEHRYFGADLVHLGNQLHMEPGSDLSLTQSTSDGHELLHDFNDIMIYGNVAEQQDAESISINEISTDIVESTSGDQDYGDVTSDNSLISEESPLPVYSLTLISNKSASVREAKETSCPVSDTDCEKTINNVTQTLNETSSGLENIKNTDTMEKLSSSKSLASSGSRYIQAAPADRPITNYLSKPDKKGNVLDNIQKDSPATAENNQIEIETQYRPTETSASQFGIKRKNESVDHSTSSLSVCNEKKCSSSYSITGVKAKISKISDCQQETSESGHSDSVVSGGASDKASGNIPVSTETNFVADDNKAVSPGGPSNYQLPMKLTTPDFTNINVHDNTKDSNQEQETSTSYKSNIPFYQHDRQMDLATMLGRRQELPTGNDNSFISKTSGNGDSIVKFKSQPSSVVKFHELSDSKYEFCYAIPNSKLDSSSKQNATHELSAPRSNSPENICPVCNFEGGSEHMMMHVFDKHLPWYFSFQIKRTFPGHHQTKLQRQLDPITSSVYNCDEGQEMVIQKMIGCLIHGYLEKVAVYLGLDGDLERLLKYVTEENLYLQDQSSMSPHVIYPINAHQTFTDDNISSVMVSPPSCVSSLAHWWIQAKLLQKTGENAQTTLVDYEAETSATIQTRLGAVMSYTPPISSETDLKMAIHRAVSDGNFSKLWQILETNPNFAKLDSRDTQQSPFILHALGSSRYDCATALVLHGDLLKQTKNLCETPMTLVVLNKNSNWTYFLEKWGSLDKVNTYTLQQAGKEKKAGTLQKCQRDCHSAVFSAIPTKNSNIFSNAAPMPESPSLAECLHNKDIVSYGEVIASSTHRSNTEDIDAHQNQNIVSTNPSVSPIEEAISEICMLCSKPTLVTNIKKHTIESHFPWFLSIISPDLKLDQSNINRADNFTCLAVQIGPSIQKYLAARRMPLPPVSKIWGKLIHGFLKKLSDKLTLSSIRYLLEFVKDKKLSPEKTGDIELELYWSKALLFYHDISVSGKSSHVSPLTLTDILHWRTLYNLLLKVTPEDRKEIIMNESYTWNSAEPYLPHIKGEIRQPCLQTSSIGSGKIDLSGIKDETKKSLITALDMMDFTTVAKLIKNSPNTVLQTIGSSEQGLVCFLITKKPTFKSAEMIRFLLLQGAPIDAVDNCGFTALHKAVSQRKEDFIILLLAWGANILIKNNEGLDAETMAYRGGLMQLWTRYTGFLHRLSKRYKYGMQNCPICKTPIPQGVDLRCHVYQEHLPWYTWLLPANVDLLTSPRNTGMARVMSFLMEKEKNWFTVPCIKELIAQMLDNLLRFLSDNLGDLRKLARDPDRNYLLGAGGEVDQDQLHLMQIHKGRKTKSCQLIDVKNPHCLSALLHWKWLSFFLQKLPAVKQEEAKQFCHYSMPIFTPHPSHTGIKLNKLKMRFPNLVESGNLQKLCDLLHINRNGLNFPIPVNSMFNHTTCRPAFTTVPVDYVLAQRQYLCVLILRLYGADLDAMDSNNQTALHRAAIANDILAVQFLLDLGADPNCSGRSHYSPLHIARTRNHLEIAHMLMSHGAR